MKFQVKKISTNGHDICQMSSNEIKGAMHGGYMFFSEDNHVMIKPYMLKSLIKTKRKVDLIMVPKVIGG